MIRITVFRESGEYRGFRCEGHAGYADEGFDIICAAVSALTVNAVNSVERFTEDQADCTSSEGYLDFRLRSSASKETTLLLDSMISGLQDIRESYGNEYIRLICKEE